MSLLRDRVKSRLSLPNESNTFDSELDDFITEAVDNLFPIVTREIPPVSVVLSPDTNVIDLDGTDLDNSNIEEVDYLEIYDSSTGYYYRYKDFTQHDRSIHLYESFDESKTVKVYGLGRYTLITLPQEYKQVIINWAMSEFYSYLVGNSSKYNLYMQASGGRRTDNMQNVSDYYLNRGNQILADRAKIRGR